MPEVLNRQQQEILRVVERLAVERPKGEVSVAEVAQALYGKDRDLTSHYYLLQREMMDLAEKGLVEQCPSLHEWRLVPGVTYGVDMPE